MISRTQYKILQIKNIYTKSYILEIKKEILTILS